MLRGMRILFPDLKVTVEVIGAHQPGTPPWRIASMQPPGRLAGLSRRRFATVEALSEAVRERCAGDPARHPPPQGSPT